MENAKAKSTRVQANRARAKRRAKIDPEGSSQRAAIARKRKADLRSERAKQMRSDGYTIDQIMGRLEARRTTVYDLLRRPDNLLVSDYFPNLPRSQVLSQFSDIFNEPMFPRGIYKQTYDKIREVAKEEAKASGGTKDLEAQGALGAGYEYLQILRMAVMTRQEDPVGQVLKRLLEKGQLLRLGDALREVRAVLGDDGGLGGQPPLPPRVAPADGDRTATSD